MTRSETKGVLASIRKLKEFQVKGVSLKTSSNNINTWCKKADHGSAKYTQQIEAKLEKHLVPRRQSPDPPR